MLVLSRKKGESIVISDSIVVTVVDLRNGKVRLGIEAPKEVPVYRKELYDKINSQESLPSPV
jgi:carbon storage regulator